jgi:hypothetical protein
MNSGQVTRAAAITPPTALPRSRWSLAVISAASILAGSAQGENPSWLVNPCPLGELTAKQAAELMQAFEFQVLTLSVERLEQDVAEVLVRHPAGIEFAHLEQIDPKTAKLLARCTSSLALNGVERLPPGVAEVLAASRAELRLESLRELTSVPLAKKLASQQGLLHFRALRRLDKPIEEILAQGTAFLELPALEQLEDEALAARLGMPGGVVEMPNLRKISAGAARGLRGKPCHLYLEEPEALDASTAQALVGQPGLLKVSTLATVDSNTLVALLQNQGPLSIAAITKVPRVNGQVAPALTAALAAHAWPLGLGLTEGEVEAVAEGLRKRTAQVDLYGVKRLTANLVASLVNCSGMIYLMQVEKVDRDVTDVLLRHRHKPDGPPSGFVLPVMAKEQFRKWGHLGGIQQNGCIHFGNLLD